MSTNVNQCLALRRVDTILKTICRLIGCLSLLYKGLELAKSILRLLIIYSFEMCITNGKAVLIIRYGIHIGDPIG